MPIQVRWLDDAETVGYWRFEGDWTWEEYFKLAVPAKLVGDAKDHRIDVIVDFTSSSAKAASLPNLLSTFRRAENFRSVNTRLVIVVGTSAFFQGMVRVFQQLSAGRIDPVRVAPDVQTARAMIETDRAEHPEPSN